MTAKNYADPDHRPLHLERDLDVQKKHDHVLSGARLILARTNKPYETASGRTLDPCYIVAWVAPWQTKITDYAAFSSKENALESFVTKQKRPPPSSPAIKKDWQQNKVYEWEGENIGKGTAKLTEKQMRRFVQQIAKDFNIVAPRIHHRKPVDNPRNAVSWALAQENKIFMRHNDLYLVMHEMAHIIDDKLNKNRWSDHSPSYVRTVIALAEKYHWCNARELERSAEKDGIMVAPARALPKLPPPKAKV